MKTVKLVMIAAFVVFTMVSIANPDGYKTTPRMAISITLDRALENPLMVRAIYQQTNPGFLDEINQLYIVKVVYNGEYYNVLGSRQGWIMFFHLKWKYENGKKRAVQDLK